MNGTEKEKNYSEKNEDPHIVWVKKGDNIMKKFIESLGRVYVYGFCYLAMENEDNADS